MIGNILIKLNKRLSIKESVQKILFLAFFLPINIEIYEN